MKGYDFFVEEPGLGIERHCRVCGTRCAVSANVLGPTCVAAALAGRSTHHDEFACPHSAESWHRRALDLAMAIDEMPSHRVAELMRQDLEETLIENLR